MIKKEYKPRVIDNTIEEYLKSFGAVCIEGPKWCGKTWTSSFHSNSEIYIGDPTGNFQNRVLAQMSPDLVLNGETPRFSSCSCFIVKRFISSLESNSATISCCSWSGRCGILARINGGSIENMNDGLDRVFTQLACFLSASSQASS